MLSTSQRDLIRFRSTKKAAGSRSVLPGPALVVRQQRDPQRPRRRRALRPRAGAEREETRATISSHSTNTGPARIRDHPTVQVGVVFPQTEIGADPAGVRAFAQAAEELGYQHLLAYDHVLGADISARTDWPGPYTAEHQFHEIFVLFGYLAGIAPGLELVTGVLVLPQRQ